MTLVKESQRHASSSQRVGAAGCASAGAASATASCHHAAQRMAEPHVTIAPSAALQL